MKKYLILALVFVLALSLLAGCFGRRKNENTFPATTETTVTPVTRPTTRPTTQPTMPSMDDMIPGTEDTIDPDSGATGETIDPTNGANQEDGAARRRVSPRF